ncbi:MAG TPA: PF20097 family protein [Pyrinomonadaceae bacterium]|jgi:hypothetical protein|nr:PF20097 family protein [Pyrinomonadaceae bacterium]
MSDKQIFEEYFCPICKNPAEKGCLMGSYDIQSMQWFPGEPSVWKNMLPLGEEIVKFNFFDLKGPYVTGLRCNNCEKIILDI